MGITFGKKSTEGSYQIEKAINLQIPHVGEQIFEHIDTDGLIQYRLVSETWLVLAGNVLWKR